MKPLSRGLIICFVALSILDAITTFIILTAPGGMELNPLLKPLISADPYLVIPIKTVAIIVIAAATVIIERILAKANTKEEWAATAPAGASTITGCCVLHNLSVIAGVM